MKGEERKAAIAACRERKAAVGIYAIRCATTGRCWAGRALNLDTIQNRLWFTLRQGNNPHRGLQAAWAEHGAAAFNFEVVERLGEEALAFARDRALKERLTHWCAALGAAAI